LSQQTKKASKPAGKGEKGKKAGKGRKIVYQGEPGANSHLACRQYDENMEALARPTFESALEAVRKGEADLAMIPIENSVAGRVADIHHLLPRSGLHIIDELFVPIRHQLMAIRGAKLSDLETVHSHIMALGQCRRKIRELGLKPVPEADTAGSAAIAARRRDKSMAVIAPRIAAEIYDLEILAENIEDADHNTTRFLVLSPRPLAMSKEQCPCITSFVFRVRNIPAALYKALGGFATNGVNMTRLESYQLEGSFSATMFYADIEGHPEDRLVRLALEELDFYSEKRTLLGVYPAHPFRQSG